jgi:CHAT domain-containing protein
VVTRIASLEDRRAVRRFVGRHKELHSPASATRLGDAVATLIPVDLDQAERVAEAAECLAERLGDPRSRALSLRSSAHVLFSRGRYAAALERYEAALLLFRSLREDAEVGRTLSSSLPSLLYLGHYDEALRRGEAARKMYERTGDRRRLARLDNILANLHYRQDRFPEALRLYQRAYTQSLEHGDPRDVAAALSNLAVCHISLNQFGEAMDAHRRARAYCQENDLPLLVVAADYNIAYLYYMRGEFSQAMRLYQLARQRAEELGDSYHQALCDLDQSELYLELNLIEEGVDLASRAHQGFRALEMGYEAAKALTNLAIGLGRQGEPLRALALFEQARELFVSERNPVWPALIDAFRALVLHWEGRHLEARRLGESALGVFAESYLPNKAALCELLLARVHLDLGELRSARKRCLSALGRLEDADSPALSYRVFLLLARVEEALGSQKLAHAAYRGAHARLENLRSHLEQDELKIGFLKDKLAVYESLVWISLSGSDGPPDPEAALAYIEQAKSRGLADLLAFRSQSLRARAPARDGLVEEVRDLRQELNWYYRRMDRLAILTEGRSPREMEDLKRKSQEREAQLLRTLRDLEAKDQEFTSIQKGATFSLEAIRSTLPGGAVLIEYYEARETILAALVTRQGLEILPMTPASRVRHLLRLLQFQLSKFRLGPEYAATFGDALLETTRSHLRELYGELLEPLRPRLDCDRLVVSPHDFLHYVPFHALCDGDHFVIDDFAVSYAPSASVHHLCAIKDPGTGSGSLVLGVPDPATPFIREEAEAVASTLPAARLLLGEAANEESLRRFGPGCRFVHVATHGLFRYDNPMFSALQLGDSRLSLFDLYQLDLGAELVTLSGCGTGLNVVKGGDELMGLVRGLLYAGARAALLTLWDVNDQSTAQFMKLFYRRLQGGSTKAQAVREAMRELRSAYSHPYYWAPFILVGQGG